MPRAVAFPATCNCEKAMITDDAAFIEHSFRCDAFTAFGKMARHQEVVRAAVLPVTTAYGVTSTNEPGLYSQSYDDGARKRPDVRFDTSPGIATDVSICVPKSKEGEAAAARAREKIAKHEAAVQSTGDIFIPF